ncbi:MAG: hypothetical protein NC908_02040 [Candidatus Omnitrophica bacterium]|nr:hypothetical protein [Candidatus Omnitrophota bacterium]
MSNNLTQSLTLLELLITLIILSIVGLFIGNVEIMVRRDIMASDQRIRLSNDTSYILEHMKKNIGSAIGDINQPPVTIEQVGFPTPLWKRIRVRIDSNLNGLRDPADIEIAYQWFGFIYIYNVRFISNFPAILLGELLSSKINSFNISYNPTNNYVDVSLVACWDPDGNPYACGTSRNPSVTMQSRIYMPSVSTH